MGNGLVSRTTRICAEAPHGARATGAKAVRPPCSTLFQGQPGRSHQASIGIQPVGRNSTNWAEWPFLQDGGDHTSKPAEAPPTKRTKTTAQPNAKTTTTTPLHNDTDGPSLTSRLIFDRTVSQHRELLTALLADLPVEAAQNIADELAGALEEVSHGKREAISNVRGWVIELVQRWRANSFQLDSGKTVQARRAEIREAAAHSATTQRSRSKGAEEQLQLVRRMTNARPLEQRLSCAE